MTYRKPLAPASTGDALGNGAELYKAGCKQVALLSLAGAAAANAPRLFFDFDVTGLLPRDGRVHWLDWSLLAWLTGSQLAALFFQIGVTAGLHGVASGRPLTVQGALTVAVRRAPHLAFVLAVVLVAITLGVALAALLANALALGVLSTFAPLAEGGRVALLVWALTAMVALLLALPLVTLLVYWYFAFLLVVTEGRGGISALRRSARLVRGHLWRMKLALTVVYLVFFVALALAEALAAAVAALFGAAQMAGDVAAFAVLAVGGAAAGPVPIAASLALLYDLAIRRAPAVR